MRRLTVFCAVMLVAIAAFCLGESRVNRQTVLANGPDGTQGRFVVVEGKFPFFVNGASNDQSIPFMVDTATGRTWIYEGPTTDTKGPASLGGWEEADYHWFAQGPDGKVHEKRSPLPVSRAPGS